LKPSAGEDFETTILFHDPLRVVVGMKSRWANRRRVTLAELVDEPWCLAPTSVGSLMTDAFRASGLAIPRIAVTTTTAHLLFQLLESGRFVGHFGDGILNFYVNRFALKKLPIELPVQPFGVAIVALKNRTISPVAQLFIDCAREVATPFVKRHPVGSRTGRNEKASGP
jgi:DNA-binding transcriptional LysR family regulator